MDTEVKAISKTTLGRKRVEYDNLSKLDGMTTKKIKARMLEDSKLYGVSIDEYTAMLEALNKPKGIGKRTSDKETRDKLIIQTQDFLSPVNTAILSFKGKITLSDTDKIKVFDTIGEKSALLADDMRKDFDGKGALTLIWTPFEHNVNNLLNVHIAGWGDGSSTERYQYAPRKVPVAKRSGYRDDSFNVPTMDMGEVKPKRVRKPKTTKTPEVITETPEA
jgi:hypothetical protein